MWFQHQQYFLVLTGFVVIFSNCNAENKDCVPRDYGGGSIVCVCSSSGCHELKSMEKPPKNAALVVESTLAGARFVSSTIPFASSTQIGTRRNVIANILAQTQTTSTTITVDKSRTYQKIIGFGGAFTDATGINVLSLNDSSLQEELIRSYFSPRGLEYNVARIPMASTDFSLREYTYDDVDGDLELKHFSLAQEDDRYKIPLIKQAISMSSTPINIFGSPWSAPGWMKTRGKLEGMGFLKGHPGEKYYKTWAQYFVKFIEAYKAVGIPIWGVTIQNEPSTGFIPFYSFQCMGMSPWTQRDFVKMDLGPALNSSGHGNVKIMVLDDARIFLPYWSDIILKDSDASKYIAGTAVHWYRDSLRSPTAMDQLMANHPDKFIMYTEASIMPGWFEKAVLLGNWQRAERYALDIIENLQHSTSGWTDWNMALDLEGGPSWVKNNLDSPIIVNATAKEFYKQPLYYALAHFTKILPRDSVHIGTTLSSSSNLLVVGFRRLDNGTALIVLNPSDDTEVYTVSAGNISFSHNIPSHAFQSLLWYDD